MLVDTVKGKHCIVYVFTGNIEGQYLIELVDEDTGDTVRSVRTQCTEYEAMEKAERWVENY